MTYQTNLNLKATDFALLFFRIALALMMLVHGIPKLLTLFGDAEIQFADPMGLGMTASLALAVFAEVICSILLLLGLGTRLAAIPLIITMLVAILIVHVPDGWGRQELPTLYAVCYVVLLLTGPGKYSLDHIFLKNKKSKIA
ncbi:DoxX family protein [Flavimarina sp. Hel_I_48]|uniref:DoxX family protein n=1 Tax=Flavimarina sp. Hel_I_48 TaxID=1392488 RepID=UPI0004DF8DC9|nr:DoxX family protein [Flavimarina sp. Hel_I_48]